MSADVCTSAPPRLEARYFGASTDWTRMARVLDWSARRHNPHWSVRVEELPPRPGPSSTSTHTAAHLDNSYKLAWWAQIVNDSADGDRLLLIDADTVVLRPLDEVWAIPFDVAYTERTGQTRFPLNGGVVFVRVSPASRTFFSAWLVQNTRLLESPAAHRQFRRTYGGMNQAALGALMEAGRVDAQLRALPCREWNCEDSAWADFDPAVTRILHVKSGLRKTVFAAGGYLPPRPTSPLQASMVRLARLWKSIERDSAAAGVEAHG